MADQNMIPTSLTLDKETLDRLDTLAGIDDRSRSYLVRQLINEAYARRYSQPNPLITVAEALKASSETTNDRS